jgi:hypothetical protein
MQVMTQGRRESILQSGSAIPRPEIFTTTLDASARLVSSFFHIAKYASSRRRGNPAWSSEMTMFGKASASDLMLAYVSGAESRQATRPWRSRWAKPARHLGSRG